MNTDRITPESRPLVRAGILLGIGLGGFADGIVFHQILQLHQMLTARIPKDSIPNIEVNMFWDGIFHAVTWIVTVAGVVVLARAPRPRDVDPLRIVGAAALLGWGLFNFVEGLVDHHLLDLHHVVQSSGESIYDVLFLVSGLVFITAGWMGLAKSAQAPTDRR